MTTLRAFLITPMRATIAAHLTHLDLVILITYTRHAVTTEDLKLENPGVPGYNAVSLGDVETSGTAPCHSPKAPIPQKQRGKKLKSQS